jgi:copper transport protein
LLVSIVRRIALPSLLVSLIVLVVGPSPASAHTGFESSRPANGETVDLPISEIVLTFTGPADPAGEGFVVLEPTGLLRAPDSLTADPDRQTWTLGFDPPVASGAVGVRWTVQAPDAHPINGAFSFTAGEPSPNPPPTTPSSGGPAPPLPSAAEVGGSASTPDQDDRSVLASAPAGTTTADPRGAIDLDAFLDQSDATVPYAEGVGAVGRLVGFVGTMLVIGGLAFATTVVRDHRRDLRSVLEVVASSALAIVAGTAIDLVAHLAIATSGWNGVLVGDALESVATSTFGLAIGLRAAAGALLFVAVRDVRRPLAPTAFVAERRELVRVAAEAISHPVDVMDRADHWPVPEAPVSGRPGLGETVPATRKQVSPWWPLTPITFVLVLALLASFTFDGHTVTEGNRWITGAVDMVHVVAASIWAGGVVAFCVVLWRRHRRYERLNGLELALRFSVIAGAGLAVAGIAGTILAGIILDDISQLWSTAWGRLLVVKTLAVAAAASVGTYNHFVVIPWMSQHPNDDGRSVRIRNTATAEAILLIMVIAATAILVGASSQT